VEENFLKAKPTVSITFLPEEHVVEASHDDESILQAALRARVEIDHSCDGNGTCGTCLVTVESGLELLGPRDSIEQEMAEDRGFSDNERLCCQNRPQNGLILRVGHKKD
jgi:2Fe-2S ferredoxin